MTSKWLFLAFLCVLSSFVSGATLNCSVTEDAELDEDGARDGTEVSIFADFIDNTGEQPWLGFDGCVNQIPAGSTINDAVLHFYTSSGSDENLEIWQYQNQTWDESEVDGYCPGVYCANAKNKLSPLICTMNGVDGGGQWQTSCNLSSAVATELAAGNDRVSFVMNNTGDAADYYNVRSKEDSGGIYTAYLYITYTAAPVTPKTVYINQSHSACSDAYTRLENNLTNPWCTFDEMSKLECGDTLEIIAGTNASYEFSTKEYLQSKSCSSGNNITIRAYNDIPYYISYTNACASWTDDSASWSGQNVWSCAQGTHNSDNSKAYLANDTMFFTFQDSADFSAASTSIYKESIYTDGATNTIYIKLSGSRNPNNEDIKIVTMYAPIEITGNTFGDNNTFIIWEDAIFRYGFRNLDINHGNFIYRNNSCLGGVYCINADGSDTAGHGPIKIHDNYFNALYDYDLWYNADMKDNGQMENSQIKISNFMGQPIIYDNVFTQTHGAVYLDSDNYNEMPGAIIANSSFTKGRGSQIEIEDYCNSLLIDRINITNSMMGLSIAPANGSLSSVPCKMRNSIILVNQSVRESSGVEWEGYAIKFTTLTTHGGMMATNWIFDHNTLYGYDNTIRKTDYSDCDGTIQNSTWTNNIFLSYSSYVLMTTGLESEGVVYDYNLYYNDPSASYDFYRYNVDCGTVRHTTLASAEASAYATTTWNDNSLNVNPLIDDWDYNPIPSQSSPVCGASSAGYDIGAIPCGVDMVVYDPDNETYINIGDNLEIDAVCLGTNVDAWSYTIYNDSQVYTKYRESGLWNPETSFEYIEKSILIGTNVTGANNLTVIIECEPLNNATPVVTRTYILYIDSFAITSLLPTSGNIDSNTTFDIYGQLTAAANCTYYINDTVVGVQAEVPAWYGLDEAVIPAPQTDGTYSFRVNCSRSTGVWDDIGPYTHILDTTSPAINIYHPAADNSTGVHNTASELWLALNISCTDAHMDIATINIRNDTNTYWSDNNTGLHPSTSYTFSDNVSLTGWPVGRYYIELNCTDYTDEGTEHSTYDTLSFDILTNITVYMTSGGTYLENFTASADGYTATGIGNSTILWVSANTTHIVTANVTYYTGYGTIDVNYTAASITLIADSSGLIFYIYDEQTNTLITWENVTIELTGATSNTYTTDTGNYSVAGLPIDYYEIVYSAPSYFQRSYYVTLLENTTSTVNLYLLNSTEGTRVFHTLYDENSNKVEDITVRLLRFYASSNSYKVVQMAKTNFEGRAQLYVELYDTYYKLQYTDGNGTTYKITNTTYWFDTETEDNIKLGEDIFQSWRTFDDGYYNLSFINSSGTIYARFIYSVTSGVVRTGCLNVQRLTSAGLYDVCNNCTTGSSAVLTCVIDTTIGGQYKAVGYIDTNTANSWYTTLVEWYNAIASTPIPKTDSMLIVALVAGSFIFVGISSLTGSVILFVFALIISSLIGLASGVGMQVIVYLAIVGIIITMIAARSNK